MGFKALRSLLDGHRLACFHHHRLQKARLKSRSHRTPGRRPRRSRCQARVRRCRCSSSSSRHHSWWAPPSCSRTHVGPHKALERAPKKARRSPEVRGITSQQRGEMRFRPGGSSARSTFKKSSLTSCVPTTLRGKERPSDKETRVAKASLSSHELQKALFSCSDPIFTAAPR